MSEPVNCYLLSEKIKDEPGLDFGFVDKMVSLGASHLGTHYLYENAGYWSRVFRYRCTESELLLLRLEFSFDWRIE